MRLSRRDALAALTAAGATVGGGAAVLRSREVGRSPRPVDERALDTLVAVAEVLYPSTVDGVGPFVERYVRGRADGRPAHRAGVEDALDFLDAYTEAWYDEGFADLDLPSREEALRRMRADAASPDPDGSDVQRVRHYVVDELLFALYTSPTGGDLLGIENPPGHPGGTGSYRRGPRP